MRASIVIACRNRAAHTLACLRSIAETTEPGTYEVVVVDNASTDATTRLANLRDERFAVLRNASDVGTAAAWNQGGAAARAPIVVFLDQDATTTAGWLPALLDALDAGADVAAACSRVVLTDGTEEPAGADGPRPGGLAVRRGQWMQLGRFREGLAPGAATATFRRSLADAGWRLADAPGSVLVRQPDPEGAKEVGAVHQPTRVDPGPAAPPHAGPPSGQGADDGASIDGVIVLGMHRSGTSALTRVLNLLGLVMCRQDDVLPPQPGNNERGFWESATLTQVNDAILGQLGGSWDRPPDTTTLARRLPELARGDLATPTRASFEGVYGTTHPTAFVWKDPRNCLLAPFWDRVLGLRTAAVVVWRNPLEVADSLVRRDGMAPEKALALWQHYVESSLAFAADRPHTVIAYRDLVEASRSTVARLLDFLDRAGIGHLEPDTAAAVESVDGALWHERRPTATELRLTSDQADLLGRLEDLTERHRSPHAPGQGESSPGAVPGPHASATAVGTPAILSRLLGDGHRPENPPGSQRRATLRQEVVGEDRTPAIETTDVVWALVRATKPTLVVEPRAWRGHCTEAIARALRENGSGTCIALEEDPIALVGVRRRLALMGGGQVRALAGSPRSWAADGPVSMLVLDSAGITAADVAAIVAHHAGPSADPVVVALLSTDRMEGRVEDIGGEAHPLPEHVTTAVPLPCPRGLSLLSLSRRRSPATETSAVDPLHHAAASPMAVTPASGPVATGVPRSAATAIRSPRPAPGPAAVRQPARGALACVVDADPRFRLEVLRWYGSATRLAGIAPADLHVNVVGPAESDVFDYLRSNGVAVRSITPFDGRSPHCNKVSGALALADRCTEGMHVLTDADVAFLEDPRSVDLPPGHVGMKPVDLPNPPLPVLRRIFAAAGVAEPAVVAVAGPAGFDTLAGNGNGGLYLVPAALLPDVGRVWSHWATWLLDRVHLMESWGVHVDQVAMALALSAEGIGVSLLEPRWNVPTHMDGLVPPEAPAVLHYHQHVDVIGQVARTGVDVVDAAIDRVNGAMAEVWHEGFPNATFWDWRYTTDAALGSGVGSRGTALQQKRGLLTSVVQALHPASVLDVGCGDGEATRDLDLPAYIGMDVSREAVRLASAKRPDDTYLVGSLADHPVEADVVLCLDVLIHQADPHQYRDLVDRLVRAARIGVVVSGYERPPVTTSPMVHFHEPLSRTLQQCGVPLDIRALGHDGDVTTLIALMADAVVERGDRSGPDVAVGASDRPTGALRPV